VMALWFTLVWARKVYRRQGSDRQSVFVTSEVQLLPISPVHGQHCPPGKPSFRFEVTWVS